MAGTETAMKDKPPRDNRVLVGRQAEQIRNIAQTLRDAKVRDRLERLALDMVVDPPEALLLRQRLH